MIQHGAILDCRTFLSDSNRMGGSQSRDFKAITQYQSDEVKAQYVGAFVLQQDEQRVLDSFSDLLTTLLKDNNLVSLEQILSSQEGCKSLFMVLSSTLEKEFNILRFPDPTRPDNSQLIMYMSKSGYNTLSDDLSRKTLCDQIVFFFIRLMTLVVALSSSIAINSKMPYLLFESNVKRTMNPNYKELVVPDFPEREPFSSKVLETLLSNGALKHLTIGDASEPDDSRAIYIFMNSERVGIDAKRRIVYMPKGRESGVMDISITPMDMVSVRPQPPVHGYPMAYMPQIPQVQGTYGQVLPPPKFLTGGRRTRNQRQRIQRTYKKQRTQRTHKQKGGTIPPNTYFTLTLKKFQDPCTGGICPESSFVLDVKGNTYDKKAFQSYLEQTAPMPQPVLFGERMETILRSEKMYPLKDPKEEAEPNKFTIGTNKSELKATFERIASSMENDAESVCPATYRAFLLASRIEGENLNTLVCSDKWNNKPAQNVLAYSLLQSLYNDRPDGTMESATASECSDILQSFVNQALMTTNSQVSTPSDFRQVSFANLVSNLPICSDPKSGPKTVLNKEQSTVLTQAHKKLRDMYERHLEQCRIFIRKVLTVKRDVGTTPKVVLDPAFSTHPRGAIVALNEVIAEARIFLSFHYLEVERVYKQALDAYSTVKEVKTV